MVGKDLGYNGLMRKRAHVYYSGRVQGVGFRFTAVDVARPYKIRGFVRNIAGGRVELVAEGEEGEVRLYLAELSRTMGKYVRDENVTWRESSDDFEDFSVRY